MTERADAIRLANTVLDRVNADPDDDLAVLARQLLRTRERAERLEARGADAIAALRACLANPQLSPAQRALVGATLDRMFTEQERWFAGPGRDPEQS